MLIRLHRAVFGERENYHAVLGTSLDDRALLDRLRDRTDRPSDHLPGTKWLPFERGFVVEGWYALCRTFPDPEALRGGMVKSFVVFAPVTEVAMVGNFATLVGELPDDPAHPWPCEVSEIEVTAQNNHVTLHDELPGLAKLARELIGRADPRMPVTWVGQKNALKAIGALWDRLWPALRASFQFGLCFAATNLDRAGLTIAIILENAAGVWPATSPLVRPDDPAPLERTNAEAALLGEPEGESIRTLFHELGVDPGSFRDLQGGAVCVTCRATLDQAGPEEVYGYLGLLARLAPRSTQGAVLKEEALRKWEEVGARFAASDVLAVRNFPADALPGGEAVVRNLVGRWLRTNLPKADCARTTAGVLLQALKSETYCQAWNKQVIDEAACLLERTDQSVAAVLWKWWEQDWQLGKFSAAHLSKNAAVEDALIATLPITISVEISRSVRALAAARGWRRLHAMVCAISLPPQAAFTAQLALPRATGDEYALRLIANHFPPRASLDAALACRDQRLVQIAGELCARNAALIDGFDWRESFAQQIAVAALDVDSGMWKRLERRSVILRDLLDLLLLGESVETRLLELLSSTDEANLLNQSHRAKLWECLPISALDGFLRATAAGWISVFRRDASTTTAPEKPLADAICQPPQLNDLLAVQSENDLAVGLRAFESLRQLDEAALQDWIQRLARSYSTAAFSKHQADRLGALIVDRKWTGAAQTLRQAVSSRHDLAPVLHRCLALFSVIERIAIRFKLPGKAPFDPEEFWAALETELIRVYPRGPSQEELWHHAGGDESLLEHRGNGRSQWIAALGVLKNGGGGKNFTARKLLTEACRHYSRNEQLALLEKCARGLGV